MNVYILDRQRTEELGFTGFDLEGWLYYFMLHKEFPSDALKFIEECKKNGRVYNNVDFVTAFNIEETIRLDDYILLI